MTELPPIRLLPVVDAHHLWVALLLESVPPLDPDQLGRLFGEFGLFDALGTLSCIVDLPGPPHGDDIEALVPAEQIVLRIPAADCLAGDCAAAGRLRSAGFHLMADGLPPAGGRLCPEIEALALACGESLPAGEVPARRLALSVDTQQWFDACRQADFHWFAGEYPLHPADVRPAGGAARHALLLQLLTLIGREAESRELEELIKQDAHLSYQLLRLVNSVAFSLSQKITSFGQAITILGRRQLQRWLQLLLYARPEGEGRSPLLPRAAARAAVMEALFAGRPREFQDRAFMAGMFSLLDALTGQDLATVVAPLNLDDDIVKALLQRSGPLGPALEAVKAGERPGQPLGGTLERADITTAAWAKALVRGYRWAIQVALAA